MWTLAKLLAILVLLFAAYVGYWLYQDDRAHIAADKFCDAIATGSQASDTIDRAKSDGRRVLENQEGMAVHFQGPIFNAYICEVTVANGKVVRRQVTAMDD
jgi:hypothetical protein